MFGADVIKCTNGLTGAQRTYSVVTTPGERPGGDCCPAFIRIFCLIGVRVLLRHMVSPGKGSIKGFLSEKSYDQSCALERPGSEPMGQQGPETACGNHYTGHREGPTTEMES